MQLIFENKRVFISGGTGSLGKTLVHTLLSGTYGLPSKIIIFSRDEAKHHDMRVYYQNNPLHDIFTRTVQFIIGDIRNYQSVCTALSHRVDIVINTAALKQVPSCEDNPYESVLTNVQGAQNIIMAIKEHHLHIETVVGISTDKACKPVNVMGMTKAIQERLFIAANQDCPYTKFVCVRYGNVLASRGSVIPLFHEQVKAGGPVTITTEDMTRFLLPLSYAVHTICNAIVHGTRGDTFIPKIPAACMTDVAKSVIDGRDIPITITGIRPGEKIHESMISEEEGFRTVDAGEFYIIKPTWNTSVHDMYINRSYNSNDVVMTYDETYTLLNDNKLLHNERVSTMDELIR